MKPAARTVPFAGAFSRRCVLDDRGRRITPVRWSRWWPMPGRVELSPEVRRSAKRNVTASIALQYNGWQRLLLMMLGTLISYVVLFAPLYLVFSSTLLPWLIRGMTPAMPAAPLAAISWGRFVAGMLGWMAVVWVVSMIATLPFSRLYWCPVIVNAVVAEKHCGSCGYSLASAPTEPDGCAICPECGAAWRIHAPASELDEVIRGLVDAGDSPMEIARRVGRSITEIEHALARTASRSTNANAPASPQH